MSRYNGVIRNNGDQSAAQNRRTREAYPCRRKIVREGWFRERFADGGGGWCREPVNQLLEYPREADGPQCRSGAFESGLNEIEHVGPDFEEFDLHQSWTRFDDDQVPEYGLAVLVCDEGYRETQTKVRRFVKFPDETDNAFEGSDELPKASVILG